jgi:folate-binding protein YgfZ
MSNCIVECHGIGAKAFLQGQLTCDVNTLAVNTPQLTACCNLQGRVIFTLSIIMKNDPSFLLIIPKSMKDIVVSHLEKYAKFSQCVIHEGHTQDPPLPPSDKTTLIMNGIPTIYPETSEKIIAQRLNLHLIPGAMSFKKGCYLGQEIIARLHFKGSLKHHMYLGEIAATAPIHIGDEIVDTILQKTGEVIDICDSNGKKILLFVNAKDNSSPVVGGAAIHALPLPYSFE